MPTTKTAGEVAGYLKYGYWYHQMHHRLYRRVDFLLTAVQAILTGFIVNGLVENNPERAGVIAIAIGFVGIFQQITDVKAKAAIHEYAADDFHDQETKLDFVDLDTAAENLAAAQSKWPDGFYTIELIALNIVDVDHGLATDKQTKIGKLGRVVKFIV